MSTEERRKWVVYIIPPLTRTNIRTMERMIARPIVVGARPIVRSPGLSRDPIALSFSSRFH